MQEAPAHFTRFCVLAGLPRKKAKYVAHELQRILCLIGFPLIVHSDNGTEFIAKEVIDALYALNPNISTVRGEKLKPTDQGSVERLNKTVKIANAKTVKNLTEQKIPGEHNWLSVQPMTMAALNSAICRGGGGVEKSPYEAVFGQKFDLAALLYDRPLHILRQTRDVSSRASGIGPEAAR